MLVGLPKCPNASRNVCVNFSGALGMVGLRAQVGVHQLMALRVAASFSGRFHGDKDGIDLIQDFRIVQPEHPSLLGVVVRVEDSETPWLLIRTFALAPD